MNGISSTLKEEIKKSHDSKKKEKLKFVAAILVTNIMVAILCLPSKEVGLATVKPIKILHPDHQMMVLPLQALVPSSHGLAPETPVSLVSRDKKIITTKAYLHEEVKTDGEITQFKIEISNPDVVKVSQATESGVIAVPYVKTKKLTSLKRGSKYEVSL